MPPSSRLSRRDTVPDEPEEEEAGLLAAWRNPWVLTTFVLAGMGLLLASLVGKRSLTLSLSGLGVVVGLVGLAASWGRHCPRRRFWLILGGGLSSGVLLITLLAPSLINPFWALDVPVPRDDPNSQVVVPRNSPRGEGKALSTEGSAEAVTEAIRQDDVLVRLESVKAGSLPDKGRHSYLLIHFRLVRLEHGEPIQFEGFSNDQHKPVLRDSSGRSYPFLEQRARKENVRGPAVFEISEPRRVELVPATRLDHLLVFELPPSRLQNLTLEVPASAWGRQGVCRFHIPGPFEATVAPSGGI